jgi:hypothetical protein
MAPEHVPGTAGIDAGIIPPNNRHLVIHECSGFEPGDDQNNLNIPEFIEDRIGENCSTSERLHAIWSRCHVRDSSNDYLINVDAGYVFPRQTLSPKASVTEWKKFSA